MNGIKSKIKPCLCGSVPSLKYGRVGYYDDRLYFFIHCETCDIKMEGTPHSPFLTNEETMKFAKELVEKWNSWISKYRRNGTGVMTVEQVSDEWINCEIEYLEKRMKFDNSDVVLTSEISSPIIYSLLKEIKEYRKSKKIYDTWGQNTKYDR